MGGPDEPLGDDRIAQKFRRGTFAFGASLDRFADEAAAGHDADADEGAGLGSVNRIDHFGGIVISGDVVFGDDCVIRNGVTVGLRHTGQRGAPVIGNRADIGAGAKVLGSIHIGDDVAIGANAVVITDVPSNSIAVGVPAKIRPRKSAQPAVSVSELTD